MANMEIDSLRIQTSFVTLGWRMHDLGFPRPLQEVEGSGYIGMAVRNPVDMNSLKILHEYLKDLAKDLLEDEKKYPHGDKRAEAVKSAKGIVDLCWQDLKSSVITTSPTR